MDNKRTSDKTAIQALKDLGLPVTDAWYEKRHMIAEPVLDASFDRGLTTEEYLLFDSYVRGETYQQKRKKEYPDLAEFVDAFYWLQRGDDSLMRKYIMKVDDVKDKYPKVKLGENHK